MHYHSDNSLDVHISYFHCFRFFIGLEIVDIKSRIAKIKPMLFQRYLIEKDGRYRQKVHLPLFVQKDEMI